MIVLFSTFTGGFPHTIESYPLPLSIFPILALPNQISGKNTASVAVVQAIRKEYATAESVQELSVEFEEGDALTLDNVSVEGTTTSGGWHVATKWDPARVRFELIHKVALYGSRLMAFLLAEFLFIVQYLYSLLPGATVECVHS